MKQVERGEVLGLADYEPVRDRFRARVIEEKRVRRVHLGPHASAVFENHDTVLLQIQEMLRTERITRESSVMHEIETYNQLVPGPHELSATIMIEIDDKETREKFLTEAAGLERHFSVSIAGTTCKGKHDPSRESTDRTTAVHYVKFDLPTEAEKALRDEKAPPVCELVSDHPRYAHRAPLSAALVRQLAEEIA